MLCAHLIFKWFKQGHSCCFVKCCSAYSKCNIFENTTVINRIASNQIVLCSNRNYNVSIIKVEIFCSLFVCIVSFLSRGGVFFVLDFCCLHSKDLDTLYEHLSCSIWQWSTTVLCVLINSETYNTRVVRKLLIQHKYVSF